MMLKKLASLILCLSLWGCSSQKEIYFDADWHKLSAPVGEPEVYGFYTHGCFTGGKEMPVDGKGYHLIRAKRGKVYGHPNLVAFLKDLSTKVYQEHHEKLLISDLAQPRGGPPAMSSKHLSHQSGLDVDIWYRRAAPFEDPDKVNPHSMLDDAKEYLGSHWQESHGEVLKQVASYPNVERVFVTPRIKERLCERYQGKAWLKKIRPWLGHTHHYHVRLRCPKGSKHCQRQAPVPPYLGCGDGLDWWFSDEAKEASKKEFKRPEKIRLPKQCYAVYHSE